MTSTIPAPRARTSRPKPVRLGRWLSAPLSPSKPFGAIRLTVGDAADDYAIAQLPCPAGGRLYAVEKLGGDSAVYHVRLSPGESTCTCPAGSFRGRCKHLDGLRALLGR